MDLKKFYLLLTVIMSISIQRGYAESSIENNKTAEEMLVVIQQKIDAENYSFSQSEKELLIALWHKNNASVPLPPRLKQIFNSKDATTMNSYEAADLTFKLPYGIAYEQAQTIQYQKLIKQILQKGIILSNQIIVDAGCGFGGLLACVHRQFPSSQFIGLEYVPSARDRLMETYPWLNVIITNLQNDTSDLYEILPEMADVIFCTEVLEHLQHPEIAVRNLLSIKKDTGVLILTVPNGRQDRAAQHINFWSPESWKIFIEKTAPGYKIQFLTVNSPNAPGKHNLCAIIMGNVNL